MVEPGASKPERDGGERRLAHPDLHLALLSVVVALLLWAGARVLPPPMFDPLGSAAVPKTVALVLVVLSAALVLPALREPVRAGAPGGLAGTGRAALMLGACILYVAVLDLRAVPFWVATAVFVPAAAATISTARRVVLTSAAMGLAIGVGGQYVLTRFFYIDLPV